MAITLLGHPSGTREVAFERYPRVVGLVVWVDAQHDPRDITPVGALLISIQHAHVRDHVLFIIVSEGWIGWGQISDIRIEWRLLHGRSCDESTTRSTQPRPRLRVKPDTDY